MKSTLTRTLALLICTGTAQAATLQLINYDLQPHRQRVLLTTQLSLSYPIGDVQIGLAMNCKTGQTTMLDFKNLTLVRDGSNPFTQEDVRPASAPLRKAVLASGLVSVGPGMLSVKQDGGAPVTSRCQGGVLDAALVPVSAFGSSRQVKVPIYSRKADPVLFMPDNSDYEADEIMVTANIYPKQRGSGYEYRDIDTRHPDGMLMFPNPKEQVLVSDGQALYPIFFGGKSQNNAALSKANALTALTVYVTMDGSHWLKTTIDATANRVKTMPAAKPKLPIRS